MEVSVDTHLKGKNTSPYSEVEQGRVKLLLSPRLTDWAQAVHLTTKNLVIWPRLKVLVEHRHTASCRH